MQFSAGVSGLTEAEVAAHDAAFPDIATLTGAAFIVGAALYVVRRDAIRQGARGDGRG